MSISAKNESALRALLMPKIKEAVDLFVQRIWNENRELVRVLVYEAYDPVDYNRTGDFKEAWETETKMNGFSGNVEGLFTFAPDKLTPGDNIPGSPRYGQHVSAIDGFLMTTYLADVIYQGLAGPAFGNGVRDGAWARKRDVWQELNKRIGAVRMKKMLAECFEQVGLNVKQYGTSWEKIVW